MFVGDVMKIGIVHCMYCTISAVLAIVFNGGLCQFQCAYPCPSETMNVAMAVSLGRLGRKKNTVYTCIKIS